MDNIDAMTEEEMKRLRLKEMFANRMQNISLEKPEGYVSKMVKREVPIKPPVPKATKKEIQEKLNQLLSPLEKSMWAPIIDKEGSSEIMGSRYFGQPWLYEEESWPEIGGAPALFVFQLNIATLPEEMAQKLGGKGLLQFFYQTDSSRCDWDDGGLVRVVDITQPGKTLPQPAVVDYVIPNEKVITGWKEHREYPHYEDFAELCAEYENLEDLASGNGFEITEMLPDCYQGDKLGGYPFWTQASEYSDSYIYQIDAGSFYDGLKVPAHAPNLFASDGTGHIFIADDLKGGNFSWACG